MAFIQFYTNQGLHWPDAVANVQNGDGDIFVCVVEAIPKGGTEATLNYGFFYRHTDGTLADCWQNSKPVLKTVNRADICIATLRDAYPDALGASLPFLDERNLVKPGEVTDQVTQMWTSQPRLEGV